MPFSTYTQLSEFLTEQFEKNNQFKINTTEVLSQCEALTHGPGLDRKLVRRSELLAKTNFDEKTICFNVEAVAFGLLSGRTKRTGSASLPEGRSLPVAQHIDITTFFTDHGIVKNVDAVSIRDKQHKHIMESFELTKQVYKSLDLQEDPTEPVLSRDSKCTLYFVSYTTFIRALVNCKKSKAFAEYAASILTILTICKNLESEYTAKVNERLRVLVMEHEQTISQKMDKIDELMGMMTQQSADLAEKKVSINKLLAFGQKASEDRDDFKQELAHVRSELEQTHEEVSIVKDHLVEKSLASTKNPKNDRKVHYAMIMSKEGHDGSHSFKFSSCQRNYINRAQTTAEATGYSVHTGPFYQANGIDYRNNIRHAVEDLIQQKERELNPREYAYLDELEHQIVEINGMLAEDIRQHNEQLAIRVAARNTNPKSRKIELSEDGTKYQFVGTKRRVPNMNVRSYEDECRSFEQESERYLAEHYHSMQHVNGITTSCINTTWRPNKHISLETLTDLFARVNAETQCSPCE